MAKTISHYPALFISSNDGTEIIFPDLLEIQGVAKDDFKAAAKAKSLLQKAVKHRIDSGEQLPEPTNREDVHVDDNSRLVFVPIPRIQGARRGPVPDFLLRRGKYPKLETWQPVITDTGAMIIDSKAPQHIKDWATDDWGD
jgi:hypothetical protein